MMYHIFICEDDPAIPLYIEDLVNRFFAETGDSFSIYIFSEGFSLQKELIKLPPNSGIILFMDISLENENGIETAITLQKLVPHLQLIFVTGHSTYIQDSFDANPVFFLIKPVQPAYFQKAMKRAIQNIHNFSYRTLSILLGSRLYQMNASEIKYIESNKRTILFHEGVHIHRYYGKLADILSQLPKEFVCCHKSYIVNMYFIHSFSRLNFTLHDGTKIPISQSRYPTTRAAFLKFLDSD